MKFYEGGTSSTKTFWKFRPITLENWYFFEFFTTDWPPLYEGGTLFGTLTNEDEVRGGGSTPPYFFYAHFLRKFAFFFLIPNFSYFFRGGLGEGWHVSRGLWVGNDKTTGNVWISFLISIDILHRFRWRDIFQIFFSNERSFFYMSHNKIED